MRSATGQIRGDDLASARVNRKVQLSPGPVLRWLPQIADVNPETRTVGEQVDSSLARDRTKREFTERREPPGQSRVIRNRDVQFEFLCQRSQESFGLPEREMKDHADRQRCLNRNVRVGALAAGLAAGSGPPGVDGVVGKPDGEAASSA
jgi:hypothetical protein